LLGYVILAGIFVTSAVLGGAHGSKLIELGALTFDGGLLTYSLSFLATDIVSEVYGRGYSRKIVIAGFIGHFTALLTTLLALNLPASPDSVQGFDSVFGIGARIFIAAMVAYLTSQFTDVTLFSWLKSKTGGRHLWLRNNVSTLGGGLLDAVLFSTIAFYGVYPVIPIIVSAYTVRIAISLLDTPFIYAGVYILRRSYPELRRYLPA